MTVSELIQQLQTYPPDMKVVGEGYEEGFDDIVEARQVKIKAMEQPKWYIGTYDYSTNATGIDAVLISGNNKGKDID